MAVPAIDFDSALQAKVQSFVRRQQLDDSVIRLPVNQKKLGRGYPARRFADNMIAAVSCNMAHISKVLTHGHGMTLHYRGHEIQRIYGMDDFIFEDKNVVDEIQRVFGRHYQHKELPGIYHNRYDPKRNMVHQFVRTFLHIDSERLNSIVDAYVAVIKCPPSDYEEYHALAYEELENHIRQNITANNSIIDILLYGEISQSPLLLGALHDALLRLGTNVVFVSWCSEWRNMQQLLHHQHSPIMLLLRRYNGFVRAYKSCFGHNLLSCKRLLDHRAQQTFSYLSPSDCMDMLVDDTFHADKLGKCFENIEDIQHIVPFDVLQRFKINHDDLEILDNDITQLDSEFTHRNKEWLEEKKHDWSFFFADEYVDVEYCSKWFEQYKKDIQKTRSSSSKVSFLYTVIGTKDSGESSQEAQPASSTGDPGDPGWYLVYAKYVNSDEDMIDEQDGYIRPPGEKRIPIEFKTKFDDEITKLNTKIGKLKHLVTGDNTRYQTSVTTWTKMKPGDKKDTYYKNNVEVLHKAWTNKQTELTTFEEKYKTVLSLRETVLQNVLGDGEFLSWCKPRRSSVIYINYRMDENVALWNKRKKALNKEFNDRKKQQSSENQSSETTADTADSTAQKPATKSKKSKSANGQKPLNRKQQARQMQQQRYETFLQNRARVEAVNQEKLEIRMKRCEAKAVVELNELAEKKQKEIDKLEVDRNNIEERIARNSDNVEHWLKENTENRQKIVERREIDQYDPEIQKLEAAIKLNEKFIERAKDSTKESEKEIKDTEDKGTKAKADKTKIQSPEATLNYRDTLLDNIYNNMSTYGGPGRSAKKGKSNGGKSKSPWFGPMFNTGHSKKGNAQHCDSPSPSSDEELPEWDEDTGYQSFESDDDEDEDDDDDDGGDDRKKGKKKKFKFDAKGGGSHVPIPQKPQGRDGGGNYQPDEGGGDGSSGGGGFEGSGSSGRDTYPRHRPGGGERHGQEGRTRPLFGPGKIKG
jgi:hypothetical protein